MATSSLGGSVYAIEINEFESNPEGSDSGNEWVELYSEEEFELDGFYLENNDEGVYNLSGSFSGYLVIEFGSQWLDNTDEKVYFKNENDEIIDETPNFDDGDNDGNSWNKCDGEWLFINSSKGEENLCDEEQDDDNDDDSDDDDSDDDGSSNLADNSNSQEFNVIANVNTNKKEKIVLNAPIKKSEDENKKESNVFSSKQEKLRLGVIYSFLIFSVVLIILLAWKRL